MTRATKPVWRVVPSTRGDMCVAIGPSGILIRRKGKRTVLGPVPFTTIEDVAAKLEAASKGFATPAPRARRKVGAS